MTDVPIDNLKSCLNCLVSVETQDDEVYQGRVESVMEDASTIILTRPFKTGRLMKSAKFSLFISPEDSVKIIEEPVQPVLAPKVTIKSTPKVVPQTSRQVELAQRSFTALDLLEKAQSKTQNGSKQSVQMPVQSPTQAKQPKPASSSQNNGVQLLQRPPKQCTAQNTQLNGPCGNPIMDLLNGHVRRGQHEFDQPIDLHEINEDFDFCGNNTLFKKKDSSSDIGYLDAEEQDDQLAQASVIRNVDTYYKVVYEDKTAPNFRHDENIVSDPKRVTSWVNKSMPEFKPPKQQFMHQPTSVLTASKKKPNVVTTIASISTPSKAPKNALPTEHVIDNNGTVDEYNSLKLKATNALPTDNGAMLPVLKKVDKQNLLAATARLYNQSMYSCIVADRFTEYVFDLHKRFSIMSKEILIIAGSACDPIILHRFTQYFYNREFKIHVYDPPTMPGLLGSKVVVYRDVESLPANVSAVYLLNAQTFHLDEEFKRWLLRTARPSQLNNTQTSNLNSTPKTQYPRLIALDFRLFDMKHMHTMYLGAADDSATTQSRMRDNSHDSVICTFEAVVADCGTPYSWISCPVATPSDAFRNSLLCRLNVT